MTDQDGPALPPPAAAAASLPRGTGRAADLGRALSLWPLLRVTVERLDGPGYLVDLGQGRGEIMLRAQDGLARRRYTLAHELAHWYLLAEAAAPAGDCRDDATERWCDSFAAHLLMPAALVQADVKRIRTERLTAAVPALARAYKVSRHAMRIRLDEVGGEAAPPAARNQAPWESPNPPATTRDGALEGQVRRACATGVNCALPLTAG